MQVRVGWWYVDVQLYNPYTWYTVYICVMYTEPEATYEKVHIMCSFFCNDDARTSFDLQYTLPVAVYCDILTYYSSLFSIHRHFI